jgi:uncharacterized protein
MKIVKALPIVLMLVAFTGNVVAGSKVIEKDIFLSVDGGKIAGTLTRTAKTDKSRIVLLISGSGPTDRDGNNPMMKNNSLRSLAHGLAQKGIPSVRYDKRGIAASASLMKNEKDLVFDDYVNDARSWIGLLRKDGYAEVIVAGHSEGALIALCAGNAASGIVSISGAARPADELLKEQLASLAEPLKSQAYAALDSLSQGMAVRKVDPSLGSLLRSDVQPYLISWFRYDPSKIAAGLQKPLLILQGTEDLQVPAGDAQLLGAAQPMSELLIVQNMNHVLKIVPPGDRVANFKAYMDPESPIASEVVDRIAVFCGK